ncbi:MAG: hypothetical protein VYA34_06350 [Myxococcota bacterium]|nr:hypothetical protein [Myxococcota bacterium]
MITKVKPAVTLSKRFLLDSVPAVAAVADAYRIPLQQVEVVSYTITLTGIAILVGLG